MKNTELRLRCGDYTLRARLRDKSPRLDVQWLRENGQPDHQPIRFELKQAPALLRLLAGFAEAALVAKSR